MFMSAIGATIFGLNMWAAHWYNEHNYKSEPAMIWALLGIIGNAVTYFLLFLAGLVTCCSGSEAGQGVTKGAGSFGTLSLVGGIGSLVVGYNFDNTEKYDSDDHDMSLLIGWTSVGFGLFAIGLLILMCCCIPCLIAASENKSENSSRQGTQQPVQRNPENIV